LLALNAGLEASILFIGVVSLIFLGRARSALTLKAVNRARFFLSLLMGVLIIENGFGIYFGFRRQADTITLEILTLALAGTAIYYSGRAREERPRENLGVAVVCMVWTVMASSFEVILGLVMG
jgi:hypothetical protein